MKFNIDITVAEECGICGYSHEYECRADSAPEEGGVTGECPACFTGMLQIVYRE